MMRGDAAAALARTRRLVVRQGCGSDVGEQQASLGLEGQRQETEDVGDGDKKGEDKGRRFGGPGNGVRKHLMWKEKERCDRWMRMEGDNREQGGRSWR